MSASRRFLPVLNVCSFCSSARSGPERRLKKGLADGVAHPTGRSRVRYRKFGTFSAQVSHWKALNYVVAVAVLVHRDGATAAESDKLVTLKLAASASWHDQIRQLCPYGSGHGFFIRILFCPDNLTH
jgi:hypothetical protein